MSVSAQAARLAAATSVEQCYQQRARELGISPRAAALAWEAWCVAFRRGVELHERPAEVIRMLRQGFASKPARFVNWRAELHTGSEHDL